MTEAAVVFDTMSPLASVCDVEVDTYAPCIAADAEFGLDCTIGHQVVIENGVRIGDGVYIGDGCFIGEGSRIGDGTVLGPRVVLREHTWIGKRVIVRPGVVLGSDGFGFAQRADGTQFKIPQVGIVEIGDDCTIDSQATIDRATLGKTVLGERVHVGPLSMVGHNVKIGSDCRFGALSGVSGSTKIGDRVQIGQHAGLVGHLQVEEDSIVGPYIGVTKGLPKGSRAEGSFPAIPKDQRDMIERLVAMVDRLDQIEATTA